MTSNVARRGEINELRKQLKVDLFNLEKKFKEESVALEKKCQADISALEREIKECEAQEVRAAREQIQQIIAATGLDPAAIFAGLAGARGTQEARTTRKPMRPSTVQHTGPKGQIWNGRGRTPQWFKERQGASNGH
jgi:DNA-binding protein H-NS